LHLGHCGDYGIARHRMFVVVRFRCRTPEPSPPTEGYREQRHGRSDPFFASHFLFSIRVEEICRLALIAEANTYRAFL
jgi:hypothetical protein